MPSRTFNSFNRIRNRNIFYLFYLYVYPKNSFRMRSADQKILVKLMSRRIVHSFNRQGVYIDDDVSSDGDMVKGSGEAMGPDSDVDFEKPASEKAADDQPPASSDDSDE
jgi:hypothetical protein